MKPTSARWLLLAALCSSGCLVKSGAPPKALSPFGLQAARARFPEANSESLERGRQLFLAHCDRCHGYPDLAHYAEPKWPHISEEMGKGKAELDPQEVELLLRFVLAARGEYEP